MTFYTEPRRWYPDGTPDGPDPEKYPYAWQHDARPLTTREDMRWLRDVYGAPAGIRFAAVYGNEDSAVRIEGWRKKSPLTTESPDWIYDAPTD